MSPSGLDLFAVGPDEDALGWPVSTEAELVAMVERLPFEPSMLMLSWLEAAVSLAGQDREAQLRLAAEFFGADAPVVAALSNWVAQDRAHLVFDPRHFATLRMLLVLHAADAAIGDGDPDGAVFTRALFATSALFEASSGAPEAPTGNFEDWLAFTIRGGAYYSSRSAANVVAQTHALWVDLARRQELTEVPEFFDADAWLTSAHGFSAPELLAFGFAVISGTNILHEDREFIDRCIVRDGFAQSSAFADREPDVTGVLATDRDGYRELLKALPEASPAAQRTPFEQRPLLRLAGGDFLLTSPHAIWSWTGPGIYYKLLDLGRAQGEKGLNQVTGFYGQLMERYCLELVDSAHTGAMPGAGRVFGDELSGPKKDRVRTPDVAVDAGEDLVLMEVVSGRFTYGSLVQGNEDTLARDITKLVDKKVAQLSDRSAQLLSGYITIADIDASKAQRVWPVLVVAEGVLAAEPLWQHIEATHPDAFGDERIRPLTIVDTFELELLMGLVEEGHPLADLLAKKTSGAYAKLPAVRWVYDEFPEGGKVRRASFVTGHWEASVQTMLDVMFPDRDRSADPHPS